MKYLFRILGGVLGIGSIAFGLFAWLFMEELGTTQRVLIAISAVGTGAYFLNYAITGRPYLFYRPRS